MNNEQYINVDLIDNEEDFIEENIEKIGTNVYQVQPYNENNKIIIKHVGKFIKICDVFINKFNLSENIECVISNTIYTENELDNIINKKILNIFKIYLNYFKGNYKNEIGIMMTNFKINKKYTGNVFEGKFVIVFDYDNKNIVLDETHKFISKNYYIENMIKYLMDEQINKIIMNKINKY